MKRALHAALVAATFCSLAACQRPAEQEAATALLKGLQSGGDA